MPLKEKTINAIAFIKVIKLLGRVPNGKEVINLKVGERNPHLLKTTIVLKNGSNSKTIRFIN